MNYPTLVTELLKAATDKRLSGYVRKKIAQNEVEVIVADRDKAWSKQGAPEGFLDAYAPVVTGLGFPLVMIKNEHSIFAVVAELDEFQLVVNVGPLFGILHSENRVAQHLQASSRFLSEVVDTFGVEPQLRMVYEETGELVAALAQYQRGRVAPESVAQEIADVLIVSLQAAWIFGPTLVDGFVKSALLRLNDRILKAKMEKALKPFGSAQPGPAETELASIGKATDRVVELFSGIQPQEASEVPPLKLGDLIDAIRSEPTLQLEECEGGGFQVAGQVEVGESSRTFVDGEPMEVEAEGEDDEDDTSFVESSIPAPEDTLDELAGYLIGQRLFQWCTGMVDTDGVVYQWNEATKAVEGLTLLPDGSPKWHPPTGWAIPDLRHQDTINCIRNLVISEEPCIKTRVALFGCNASNETSGRHWAHALIKLSRRAQEDQALYELDPEPAVEEVPLFDYESIKHIPRDLVELGQKVARSPYWEWKPRSLDVHGRRYRWSVARQRIEATGTRANGELYWHVPTIHDIPDVTDASTHNQIRTIVQLQDPDFTQDVKKAVGSDKSVNHFWVKVLTKEEEGFTTPYHAWANALLRLPDPERVEVETPEQASHAFVEFLTKTFKRLEHLEERVEAIENTEVMRDNL